MIEPEVGLGLKPDLGFVFSELDVEIIDFDIAGLIFSFLSFEALATVDEFDTRVTPPLDLGDEGAVVLR